MPQKVYLGPENSAHIVSSEHNAQLNEDANQVNAFSATATYAAASGTCCIKSQQQRRQLTMGPACPADSNLGKRLGA